MKRIELKIEGMTCDHCARTVEQALRDRTLSDPRGIAWNAEGTRAYVTGLGTDNVIVLDGAGARAGIAPTIEVGEGPTGVALDQPRERLYVLNRFEASISVVSTQSELELARVPFFDPTPEAIRAGRRFLYDAHLTSGLGLTACAACHADARMDRLAWDLGDPSGAMQDLTGVNRGANMPHQDSNFVDFHPMKGPMLTQTLQDIVGREPFHWRGDRAGIEAFNPAFESLLGDDEQLERGEMHAFEDFLATIAFPPNPFRELDNALSTRVSLAGLHTPGRFAPGGQPMPDGNAVNGRALFDTPVRFACTTCRSASASTCSSVVRGGPSSNAATPSVVTHRRSSQTFVFWSPRRSIRVGVTRQQDQATASRRIRSYARSRWSAPGTGSRTSSRCVMEWSGSGCVVAPADSGRSIRAPDRLIWVNGHSLTVQKCLKNLFQGQRLVSLQLKE